MFYPCTSSVVICTGKGILVFDTVGGQHVRARESSLSIPHSYGQSRSGMTIDDLLSIISYLVLSFFCLFYIFHPSCFHFPRSDVNECTDVIASCGLGAECINLNGSFDCQCLEGFQKIGDNCAGHTTVIPVILPVYFSYLGSNIDTVSVIFFADTS